MIPILLLSLKQGRRNQGIKDTSASEEEKEDTTTADYKAGHLEREMRKLDTSWNPAARETMENATVIEADEDGKETNKNIHFVFNVELHGDDGTPADYKEAMQGKESEQWGPSMAAEILNFVKQKSWNPVQCSETNASGRTIMKTKWVY
jgi:hypothetical protein